MRELEIVRRLERWQAQRAAGVYPNDGIHTEANAALAGMEGELFLLAEEVRGIPDLQGPGGGFGFMLGFSVLGGSDPLL